MMIAALITASLAATQPVIAHRVRMQPNASPCQAVPTLCMGPAAADAAPRLAGGGGEGRANSKMDAYRFDARPCRLIGNMGCAKRARTTIFQMGVPITDTLRRTFGVD